MAFAVSSFVGKAVAAKAAQTVASSASRRVTVRAGLYPVSCREEPTECKVVPVAVPSARVSQSI